jgi:tetratricopeptide (TPR) repeat protein
MASEVAASSPSRAAEWRSAGVKVGVTVAVGAALLVLYAHEVRVETQVKELVAGAPGAQGVRVGGAQSALAKDTPGGWQVGEAALGKALELQPSNPYALAAMAAVEQELAADGFADRAPLADAALARAEAKDVNLPERHEAHALSLIRAGRPVDAETYLRPLVDRYSSGSNSIWRLWDALGRAQRAAGKLEDAKKSLRRAMEIGWRSPRAVADYATLLLEEGSAVEAASAFDRALQANADHLRSLAGKSRAVLAMAAQGKTVDLKSAVKLADEVATRPSAELSPALRALGLGARAEAKLRAGDAPGAAQDAEAALAAQPAAVPGLRARALVLAADPEKRQGAFDAFKQAIAKDPYDASLYFDGSVALAAAAQLPQAEKLLGSYAALLPKTARYQLALSRLLVAKGDLKGARAALDAAAQAEPTNAVVFYEQGRLAQRRGDAQGARDAYERAVQLRDDYPEVYRQMGALYLEGSDVDGALAAYVEALRRYKAARVPEAQLEPFYREVHDELVRARQAKKAAQWLKDARAAR